MNWSEVITVFLLLSNVIYAFFRIIDYFHQRKNRESEEALHKEQTEFNAKVSAILEHLEPKG